MSYPDLNTTVETLAAELDTKLSFGYTGNCSTLFDASRPQGYPFNYDDRSWCVWFHDFPRGEPFARYNNVPSLPLGDTSHLPTPEELARKIQARYAQLKRLRIEHATGFRSRDHKRTAQLCAARGEAVTRLSATGERR